MQQLRFTLTEAACCDTCGGELPEPEPADEYDDRSIWTRNNGDRAHVGCALGPRQAAEPQREETTRV